MSKRENVFWREVGSCALRFYVFIHGGEVHVGARCRGYVTNRPFVKDESPGVIRVVLHAGHLLTRFGTASCTSDGHEERLLYRVLKRMNGGIRISVSFRYRYNGRVFVNSGMVIGVGYAFISGGHVSVNDGILVTSGMRVCATARSAGMSRHVIRSYPRRRRVYHACTLPMQVRSKM